MQFHRRGAIAAGLSLAATSAWAAEPVLGRLTLRPEQTLNILPRDYCGFSVETVQLADPDFFHPANASLITLCRRLSPEGVLRIGGNSSEFCWWRPTPDTPEPAVHAPGVGQAGNTMPQHFTPIIPAAVDNLRGFLDACGWSCIWGLDLGTGSPERDCAMAAYVAQALGPRLRFFQIGNEPNFYHNASNGLRAPGWGFADYLDEWTAIARAVLARAPGARFGGPDAGDWGERFAREAPARVGSAVVCLTSHYYAEGPPTSPKANITDLLAGDPAMLAKIAAVMPAARAAGLPFRITEANSCYRGGKPGVSDVMASALWGGDYMLALAALGCQGVCFHGGPGGGVALSNGDATPGARSSADMDEVRRGALYSPFAGSRAEGFSARPLFYGMMLVQALAGGRLAACDLAAGGVNATAYAAEVEGGWRIALFNKDAHSDLALRLDLAQGTALRRAKLWRLDAPSLDSRVGVTLAGDTVSPGDATWTAKKIQRMTAPGNDLRVLVPKGSAALVSVQA